MTYREILQHYFGYDDFRGIQEPIIESIGSGRDTLGLMPTGGGKSITFQVPALAMEGICIVVTPLVALMKDQVAALKARAIKACAINSSMSRADIITTLENCIFGGYKFLYISPERIGTDLFRSKVKKMHVNLIAVDESHCISQWGYDFRPAYLAIAQIRDLLPGVPVLALTATATPDVITDIQRQLHFRHENVFRMSFARPNLIYVVRETASKDAELLHILTSVAGTAIVYVRSLEKTGEVTRLLTTHGISATFYHAGLDPTDKDFRQQAWSRGEIRVMVATNAFGMGIDKADVRRVIHYEMPDSPESYFQETGRGGRDGRPAYAVLLYHPTDQGRLTRRVSQNYPPQEFVRKVYDKLSYHFQMALGDGEGCRCDFHIEEFCHNYHLPSVQTESALRLLTQMGYLLYEEEVECASRLTFTVRRDELYAQTTSPDQEVVVRTLLRLYTGIFTDYAFIDEHYLALQCGFGPEGLARLTAALLALSRACIVRYIPARRTPAVTWLRARVESDQLVFTSAVYDDRKVAFRQRIEAMRRYALTIGTCRQRLLLAYFGERLNTPCGCCDNCRRRLPSGLLQAEADTIASHILNFLADGKPHPVEDLVTALPFPTDKADAVLTSLLSEEILVREGTTLRLQHTASSSIPEYPDVSDTPSNQETPATPL